MYADFYSVPKKRGDLLGLNSFSEGVVKVRSLKLSVLLSMITERTDDSTSREAV